MTEAQKGWAIVAVVVVGIWIGFKVASSGTKHGKWTEAQVQKFCREGPGEWVKMLGHASNGEVGVWDAGITAYRTAECVGAWNHFVTQETRLPTVTFPALQPIPPP